MKTRLAPTPSGFLHRGNAANFALNSLLANGGDLLLRIDDLDRGRFRPEYLADIFEVVDWLGIKVTVGPTSAADFMTNWSQETRMPAYRHALESLRQREEVFACPCTRKELADGQHAYNCRDRRISLDASNVAWRIDTQLFREPLSIPDIVSSEGFMILPDYSITDFVIRKKDGSPSYQLACTVDDVFFGTTHVGRGQDLLPSTAAQAILSDLLGYGPLFDRIRFVHHPLLRDENGSKLSKSAGAKGVSALRNEVTPDTLFAQAKAWLGG